MTKKTIKLIIAEDHDLLREMFVRTYSHIDGLSIIGQASNGQALMDLVLQREPDIIILDLEMPILSGYAVLPMLTRYFPAIKIIVLSSHGGDFLYRQLILDGAHAYLPKNCNVEDVVLAIKKVYKDGYYFDRMVSKQIVQGMVNNRESLLKYLDPILSGREIELLRLFCEGKSQKEISDQLHISLATVKWHFKNIHSKTQTHTPSSLLKYAIANGIRFDEH